MSVTFGVALDFGSKLRSVSAQLDRQSRLAEQAEQAGFELVAAGEIPAAGGFHLPNALLVLASLAQRTGLRLCTGVLLLPAWQAWKLGLDTAELDRLSGGRLILGVGLGNAALHAQAGWTAGTIAERADETLAAVRALWSGAAEYQGQFVSVAHALPLTPETPGGPPIWVGGSIRRSVVRAAQFGNGWYGGVGFRLSLLAVHVERYRQAQARITPNGQSGAVALNRVALAAPTERDVAELVERHFTPTLKGYVRDQQTLQEAAADTALVGTPAQIVALVERYAAVGVTHVIARLSLDDTPPEVAAQTIDLFGREVIPRFA